MKVKKVKYNWHQVGSAVDRDGAGEDWNWFEVGQNGVTEIKENHPTDGMPLNYVVIAEDKIVRIFNPNYVEYL